MPFHLNVSTIASTPIYAGIAAALVIALMNLLYKWKTTEKPTNKSIAYNALVGFVVAALLVVYAKKSLVLPDEYLDTRPAPF